MDTTNYNRLFRAYVTELKKLAAITQMQGLGSTEYRMCSTLCLSYREAAIKAKNGLGIEWDLASPGELVLCSTETALLAHDAVQRLEDAIRKNNKRLADAIQKETAALAQKGTYLASMLKSIHDKDRKR